MLAIAGAICLAAAVGVHHWNLRRGVYRRVPYGVAALLAASAVLSLLAALRGGGTWRIALAGVGALALLGLAIYLFVGARFPRHELSIHVGDKLPRFELPDSEGNFFDSATLVGKAPALYLFYRGNW